jgi:hypothetical protein
MIIPKSKRLSVLLSNARICVLGLIPFVSVFDLPLALGQTQSAEPSRPIRERILIDDDWRFQKGDPAGATGLLYDVRALLEGEVKDKAPDAAKVIEGQDVGVYLSTLDRETVGGLPAEGRGVAKG